MKCELGPRHGRLANGHAYSYFPNFIIVDGLVDIRRIRGVFSRQKEFWSNERMFIESCKIIKCIESAWNWPRYDGLVVCLCSQRQYFKCPIADYLLLIHEIQRWTAHESWVTNRCLNANSEDLLEIRQWIQDDEWLRFIYYFMRPVVDSIINQCNEIM